MKLSDLKSLNIKDLIQGLIFALIAAIITYAVTAIQSGDLSSFKIKEILFVSVTAIVTYLSKRFLSNSEGEFLTKEKNPGGSI